MCAQQVSAALCHLSVSRSVSFTEPLSPVGDFGDREHSKTELGFGTALGDSERQACSGPWSVVPMAEGRTRPKILLCVSGSVAVVKVPQLAAMLAEFAEVCV